MAVSSLMVPLGTPAPDFALADLAGTTVRRDDFAAASALLVAFLCTRHRYPAGSTRVNYPANTACSPSTAAVLAG
jgi:peroxiredoxin